MSEFDVSSLSVGHRKSFKQTAQIRPSRSTHEILVRDVKEVQRSLQESTTFLDSDAFAAAKASTAPTINIQDGVSSGEIVSNRIRPSDLTKVNLQLYVKHAKSSIQNRKEGAGANDVLHVSCPENLEDLEDIVDEVVAESNALEGSDQEIVSGGKKCFHNEGTESIAREKRQSIIAGKREANENEHVEKILLDVSTEMAAAEKARQEAAAETAAAAKARLEAATEREALQKKRAEMMLQAASEAREAAEKARQEAAAERVAAELARQEAMAERQAAEQARLEAIAEKEALDRAAAEASRLEAAADREAAERARREAAAEREAAERIRREAAAEREAAEAFRRNEAEKRALMEREAEYRSRRETAPTLIQNNTYHQYNVTYSPSYASSTSYQQQLPSSGSSYGMSASPSTARYSTGNSVSCGVYNSNGSANGRQLFSGPRGGTFYYTASGNKRYV